MRGNGGGWRRVWGVRKGRVIVLILVCAIVLVAALGGRTLIQAFKPASFSYAAAGDFGANKHTEAVLRAIKDSGVAFTLALGDMSYNEVVPESAWCTFVKRNLSAKLPFDLVPGGHEDYDNVRDYGRIGNFATCLPNQVKDSDGVNKIVGEYPWQYYFDYPADKPLLRTIQISPWIYDTQRERYAYTKGSLRYSWLMNTIDDARKQGIKWINISWHFSCFEVSGPSSDCKYWNIPGGDLMNMLIARKVDLITIAHVHSYERTKQLAFNANCKQLVLPNSTIPYNSSCIAHDGADRTYVKGDGPIMLIVGTGGAPLDPSIERGGDSLAGYFATWMGKDTPTDTWGFGKFTVSENALSFSFVAADGSNFTDSFEIRER